MSADKRTVATDALETLGTIISENEKRDAIHLAVEPVVAKVRLLAGQDVSANGDLIPPYVGIVDPFLKVPVLKGQRFWLVIYPRQINSLRHVWSHPAFPDETDLNKVVGNDRLREEAEAKLRAICENWDGPSYEDFLEVATSGSSGDDFGGYYIDGEYLHGSGRDAHGEIPQEAWGLVETITGKRVQSRPNWFSCSC